MTNTDVRKRTADRAKINAALVAANFPPEIENVLHRQATLETIDERIRHARTVIGICATAQRERLAADFVRANTEIATVREILLNAMAAADEKVTIDTMHHCGTALAGFQMAGPDVYELKARAQARRAARR